MGIVTQAFSALAVRNQAPDPATLTPTSQVGNPQPVVGSYATYAQAYRGNEIIYKCIEMRADSAAEPRVIGKRTVKESVRRQMRTLAARAGASQLEIDHYLSPQALTETVTDHPAVELLNHPNPFMSRFDFWATVNMHRDLAGNAYAWIGRDASDTPVALFLLRPDRVRVIPGGAYVVGYCYTIGGQSYEMPARDVIHFKMRDPLNDWYGMPPLMAVLGRMSLDNYMRDFLLAFFRNGGHPGAILALKQKLSEDTKKEMREKFHNNFGGSAGWFDLMVLDAAEASYTPMTAQLGQRGLVMPELNAITEARLTAAYGVPASIHGLLVGLESSSYANKRADWQVFWDITLTPIYIDHAETLNLSFLPNFTGLDELLFDLAAVRALQEDVDAIHARWIRDFQTGAVSYEEFRAGIGLSPQPPKGSIFYVPSSSVPTQIERLGEAPEPAQAVAAALMRALAPPAPEPPQLEERTRERVAEARCPACNALGGKNTIRGELTWCRKCKQDFPAGGAVVDGQVLRVLRRRFERDAEGRVSAIVEGED